MWGCQITPCCCLYSSSCIVLSIYLFEVYYDKYNVFLYICKHTTYSEILLSHPSIVDCTGRATVLLGFKYPLCQYRTLITLKLRWLCVMLVRPVLMSHMANTWCCWLYSGVRCDCLCLLWHISLCNDQRFDNIPNILIIYNI